MKEEKKDALSVIACESASPKQVEYEVQGEGGRIGTASQSCCCRHKETPRNEEFQQDLQRRLNRAIGQLNGVKAMIDDNRYCGDVLIQLAAAESAVHRVSSLILKNHLETCVVEQVQLGNVEIVDEAMGLINKFGGLR